MGAMCLGCALANVARVPVHPVALVAGAPAAFALVVTEPRLPVGAAGGGGALGGGGGGGAGLVELDRSTLVPRMGGAERAVAGVDDPPRGGSFDRRARAAPPRWGTLRPREPVYLELPLGRSPPQG